jgi:NAD(P)H dehydrogenase (quinone)
MIVVTGATGQLGRLVIAQLLKALPPEQIVAAVRTPAKAGDLAALGVQVREADYGRPETLGAAFAGAEKLLLISSSEIGRRAAQHRAAIDAAKRSGIELIAYTSVLHADVSPLGLAEEHRQTEAMLREAGVPFVLLRNGWYTENYVSAVPAAAAHGALMGSAADGRISSASRADYAAAAVAVLTRSGEAGRVYELAGDAAYTLSELAAEISRQAGQPVDYKNLSEGEYKAALVGMGLPAPLAALLADSDIGASKGGLFDEGRQLSRLIGRPTTPMRTTVAAAIAV